jgi:hypothetical protein
METSFRLGPNKDRYCIECAQVWHQEDKERQIRELYEDGPPQELFAIPKTTLPDPATPGGQEQLGGDLIFTDKAICFASVVRFKTTNQQTAQLAFGVIGALIASSKNKRARREAWSQAPGGGLSRLADDLAEHLYLCDRVVVVPRRQVTKLGPSFWTGPAFRVYTPASKLRFELENGRKTWKQYRDWIDAYRDDRPMPMA